MWDPNFNIKHLKGGEIVLTCCQPKLRLFKLFTLPEHISFPWFLLGFMLLNRQFSVQCFIHCFSFCPFSCAHSIVFDVRILLPGVTSSFSLIRRRWAISHLNLIHIYSTNIARQILVYVGRLSGVLDFKQ